MLYTVVLGFLAGLLGANSTPHLVKGITKESYPTVFGSSPVRNLIAGWAGFCLTGLVIIEAHLPRHPLPSLASIALGALLMGLFHARVGAFGRG